jgi:hypothetical protein
VLEQSRPISVNGGKSPPTPALPSKADVIAGYPLSWWQNHAALCPQTPEFLLVKFSAQKKCFATQSNFHAILTNYRAAEPRGISPFPASIWFFVAEKGLSLDRKFIRSGV